MITTLMNYKGYLMAGLGFIFLIICGYAIYLNLSLENTKIKLEQEKEEELLSKVFEKLILGIINDIFSL